MNGNPIFNLFPLCKPTFGTQYSALVMLYSFIGVSNLVVRLYTIFAFMTLKLFSFFYIEVVYVFMTSNFFVLRIFLKKIINIYF